MITSTGMYEKEIKFFELAVAAYRGATGESLEHCSKNAAQHATVNYEPMKLDMDPERSFCKYLRWWETSGSVATTLKATPATKFVSHSLAGFFTRPAR